MECFVSNPRLKIVTMNWLIDSLCGRWLLPLKDYKSAMFGSQGKWTLVVPKSPMAKFLAVASNNSAKNIEPLGTQETS